MSRILQIQPVVQPSGIGFPVKAGTWDFLQDAHRQDMFLNLISRCGTLYSSGSVYILWGCQISTGGGNTVISAGSIFYQGGSTTLDGAPTGEIFYVPGNSIVTPSGSDVVICNINTTYYQPTDALGNPTADPVNFINFPPTNVHAIRTMQIGSGLTGTGTVSNDSSSDYSSLQSIIPHFRTGGVSFGVTSGYTIASAGPPLYPFGYKIIDSNEVSLCGGISIINTSASGGTVNLFTLPSIARPSSKVVVTPGFPNGDPTIIGLSGTISISTSGVCSFTSTAGAGSCILNFDGVKFRIS